MKKKFFTAFLASIVTFAVGVPAGSAAQIEVPLKHVKGPGNSFHDPTYGVSLTYPTGWALTHGFRWGPKNEQTTFVLRRSRPNATTSIFYQKFTPDSPRPQDPKVWFRDSFQKKEATKKNELQAYRNVPDSLKFDTTAAGLPKCSYVATYTGSTRAMAEHYVRVAGQESYVMFITVVALDDVDAIRADIDRMADTVKVP